MYLCIRFIWTLLFLLDFAAAGVTQEKKLCEELTKKTFLLAKKETCLLKAKELLQNSFSSSRISINCTDCEMLHGETLEDLQNTQSFRNKLITGLLNLFSGKNPGKTQGMAVLRLSPYLQRYILVENNIARRETVKMTVKIGLDPTCIACLVLGAFLFCFARTLSSSVKFYYTSGIGVGILASVLVIVFVLSRFVPKKPAAYSILIGGWSLGAWLMRLVWNNWYTLLAEYYVFFIAYIGVAGFLSFALCYWKGPVTNPKSQHIIQWSIQLFGLFLLYCSSQSRTVSIAIVAGVVLGNLLLVKPDFGILSTIKSFFWNYIWKSKPSPPRLLTEEEYRIQGEIETKKALEELRQYCNSPKCSPWKTMSRIQSPVKFISFMEGENHLSDAEMTLHDAELSESDDENDSSLISDDETETDDLHKGDNGTTQPKQIERDPNISEDED